MEYLRYFETTSAFTEAYTGDEYKEPWVSYTEENLGVKYNKSQQEKLLGTPFTIEALESGTIQWNLSDNVIEYSMNGGEWDEMDSETTLTVASGDVISFRGDNYSYGNSGGLRTINATCRFNVYGNIMSLISRTGFENNTIIPDRYCFAYFFMGGNVVDASNLILPATTLANNCYLGMFYGCTNLTSAPELPATTLVEDCYSYMFENCTSLTTAPALPATTLASKCYNGMFWGCTSLTTAPALPATTLANNCYLGMFASCTSLTTAPALPATTLADYCYTGMFQDCTSLTTAPELPATALAYNCYCDMFHSCNLLTVAPELPATTLADYCYSSMFTNCASLNYIKCLATNISAYDCTSNWVNGVAASGTFVKNANMSSWTTGTNGVPSGWSVVDA